MKIDSLERIQDNLGYIIQKRYNGFKKTQFHPKRIIYNCAPKRMKDGSVKHTFIEVGYLYLTNSVKDDSHGFVYFDCTDHINYDKEHKIIFPTMPEPFWDKIVGKHNSVIAQIYNSNNITWNIVKGQALFTTKKEAEDYIKQCENGDVEISEFFLKIEKVIPNPTNKDY